MDRLEIISPTGEIKFYPLDLSQPSVNIGQDPENDIVLADPKLAPFMGVLVQQPGSFRFLPLSDQGGLSLDGQALVINHSQPLKHMDCLQLGGYSLILLEAQPARPGAPAPVVAPALPPSSQRPTPPAQPAAPSAAPAAVPTAPAPQPPGGSFTMPQSPQQLTERLDSSKSVLDRVRQTTYTVDRTISPVGSIPMAAEIGKATHTMGRALSAVSRVAQPLTDLASTVSVSPAQAAPRFTPEGRPFVPQKQAAPEPLSLVEVEDEVILTELLIQEVTIDVEQTATYQITIINGGDLVATFNLLVEGLDESWVTISPRHVNLYEGNRATITISVTPPRLPTSYAGPHKFALSVVSPNYPGRINRRLATLTINPYYEFGVGEVTPRQQTISWFKRAATASIAVINKGNSKALFRVGGRDDERGCNFEFQVPGQSANVANQAEFYIPPSDTVSLPITITPNTRQFIGFRKRSYAFTITSSLPDGAQSPYSMLGQLKTSPLIGPLLLLMMALMLAALIVYIFKPSISTFNADGAASRAITAGEPVTLNWRGSPFTRLKIPQLSTEPLESPQGSVQVIPTANTSYELKGDNWLSQLSPGWFGVEPRVVSVIVTPVPPQIRLFGGNKQDIVSGESVLLSWEVAGAESVSLVNQADGNPKPLPGSNGSLDTGPLDRETTYYLEAGNVYIATPIRSDPFIVRVSTPTPTPMPTPAIARFFANPPAIVAGESTTLEWEVAGVDQVDILGIGAGLPAAQSISLSPEQTTNYVLNAANGSSAAKPQSLTIFVTPAPTATPPPTAPQIKFFTANPDSTVLPLGSTTQIGLEWAVEGQTTNVEISGPTLNSPISGLSPQGSVTMSIQESTLFVLTAFNSDAKTSTTVEITVNEPTPTATLPPTATPPPTPTATPPAASIFFFKIEPMNSSDTSKVVQIADGSYTVETGTDIKLTWQVSEDATDVTLSPGGSYGPGPNYLDILSFSTKTQGQNPAKYVLTTKNMNGLSTSKEIKIKVVPKPTPAPPSGVTGTTNGDDNIIRWSWSGSEDILGFRVYRSDVPPGNDFDDVHDAGASPPFEWIDSGAGCGKVYYVVTLYVDVDLKPLETGSSGSSWSSGTCP